MVSTTHVVLLSTIVHLCGSAVNYCGAKMCGYTNAHTFCQYPAGPSPSCAGYIEAPLTLEEKVRILTRLNRRRSDAATGRLRHLPTAGDMLKLRWVEELAREAQRWADQCRPPHTPDEHDACRDLYSVSVGQSVASVVGEAPGLRAESMVDMWYMQSIHYKGNVTNYSPPMSTVNYYGDFAQIVWSYTYMVGCGRSRFMILLQGRMRSVERLVCNFAPRGPISGQEIWRPDEPASLCPSRSLPDKEFRGLCAYQPYTDLPSDTDNTTTIEENTLLNIIFDIEMNDVLNYPGSMDELFLTKIAIATLKDTGKTEPYNTFHKRDVVDINNELTNHIQENNNELTRIDHLKGTNSTNLKSSKTTVKVKFIGRPKSYNADDLSDVGGTQTTENYDITADLPKEKKEFYADYQYSDAQEGELASTENMIVVSETSPVPVQITTENVSTTIEMTYAIHNFTTLNVIYGSAAELDMMNLTSPESIENIKKYLHSLKDEAVLSDPEMVRDLELVLSQMEQQSMETTTTTPATEVPEKVKRDLRETSDMTNKPKPSGNIPSYLKDLNMTADKAPMLNMILKYLPYLKPYQNDILAKVTSSAVIVTPSYFVSVILYLILMLLFVL